MENPVMVVQQAAKVEAVKTDAAMGMSGADPVKIAEFEKLMANGTNGTIDTAGISRYQVQAQGEASAPGWGGDIVRVGTEISREYRKEMGQISQQMLSFDPNDPVGALRQTMVVQAATQAQMFKLQFATSIVDSVNRGITTLFRLQG